MAMANSLIFVTIGSTMKQPAIMKSHYISDIINYVQKVKNTLLAQSTPHNDHAVFELHLDIHPYAPLFRIRKETLP